MLSRMASLPGHLCRILIPALIIRIETLRGSSDTQRDW
jgi:hypothetical protein